MNNMPDKKGEGYVTPCVIIMSVCMLLSVFISFVTAVNVVRITKRNTKNVLDSFIMLNAIDIYDSVKTGNNLTDGIDQSAFTGYFCEYCGLSEDGAVLTAVTADGKEKYSVEGMTLILTDENKLSLKVEYTVIVPVSFGDFVVTHAAVPVSVISRFDPKF